MNKMGILENKIALITGASRGIGRAIAKAFEAEGAKLVLTAKDNIDLLKDFEGAKIIKLDLSKGKDIDFLIEETLKEYKRIDILINNAGIFKQTEFELITEEELNDIINIDLKGPFLLIQKVINHMKKQKKGKIINISSGAGKFGSSSAPHYAAAKAGIIALTKSLARRYGKYNLNINAVAPSLIDTDMIKQIPKDRLSNLVKNIPLKRLGTSQEVASLVLFLASNASDYITGQTINIDGGISIS